MRKFQWDGLTPVLIIGIGVQNTSNQSFTIRSFAGNIYSDDYYIGNISNFTPQQIPPNSQVIVQVIARLQLISIVNEVIEAVQYQNFKKEIEVKAMANVDGLQVPVNQKLSVGLSV